MTSRPVSADISRTKSFSKIQWVTTKSMNEGSQTNLATCDLFPVAMMSFTPATPLLLNIWRSAPTVFKTNLFFSLLPETENKKLKIEQLATYKCTW